MSHLQRVRGQTPTKRAPHALFAAAAAVSLVAGIVSGVSLARGAEWLTPDAPLADVSVKGARHLDALEIATAAGIDPAAVRSNVSPTDIQARLEEHAWIARARALRLPNGRLLLDVEERVPAAVVGPAGSDPLQLTDASGAAFADAPAEPDPKLPRIVTAAAPSRLEPDAGVARAIELARALPGFGLSSAVEITLADDPTGLTLRLAGVKPRFVLGRDDLDSRLKELARLLTAGVPEVAEAGEIDLRFADQAVLRNESPPEEAAPSGGDARMRGAVHSTDRPGDPAV